jgi:hypothetical protein
MRTPGFDAARAAGEDGSTEGRGRSPEQSESIPAGPFRAAEGCRDEWLVTHTLAMPAKVYVTSRLAKVYVSCKPVARAYRQFQQLRSLPTGLSLRGLWATE